MIERLRPLVDGVVEVRVSGSALAARRNGQFFAPPDRDAADKMFGAMAHKEAAVALTEALRPMIRAKKNRPHNRGPAKFN